MFSKNVVFIILLGGIFFIMCWITLTESLMESGTTSKRASKVKVKDLDESSQWVDPHDMLGDQRYIRWAKDHDETEETERIQKPEKEEKCSDPDATCGKQNEKETKSRTTGVPERKGNSENDKNSVEVSYFKQLTRCVLDTFDRPGKKYVTIDISEYRLKRLKEFFNADDGEEVHDTLNIICDIFSHLKMGEIQCHSLWSNVFMSVSYNMEIFAVGVICVTLVAVILVLEKRTSVSLFHQFMYLLSGLFVISIPWEWIRLYKHAFAAKQAAVMKEMPDYCKPGANLTIFQSLSHWMSNLVQWQDDECGKYHGAILVDPVWEVSPSQAFSITVTRFFSTPLKPIAEDVGKSLNIFFHHIPGQWQPLMFLAILMLLTLVVIVLTKTRLKFWLFEIGPQNVEPRRRLTAEDITALETRFDRVIRRALRTNQELGAPRKEARELEQREESPVHPIPDTQPAALSAAKILNYPSEETKTPGFDAPLQEVEKKVEDLHI